MKEMNNVLDSDEKVIWNGSPSFWPFFLGGSVVHTIFGIVWLIILLPIMGFAAYDFFFGSRLTGFSLLLLPHFWLGAGLAFGVPLYHILVYKHTHYAITEKRVLLQKGIIGRDFEMVDFDQIANIEVNIGISDKLLGNGDTGSILVFTPSSHIETRHGILSKPHTLRNIHKPYETFKLLKQVAHDVKTDIQYPNKLRPDENPGYRTDYRPKAS